MMLFYIPCKDKFIYFIYLFLAVLGLHCCVRAFSSCGRGLLLVVVHGLLIAVASLDRVPMLQVLKKFEGMKHS